MRVLPSCESNAIECQKRADGGAELVLIWVQLLPSHSHVSAWRTPLLRPPKSTTRLRTESNAIAWPNRGDGDVAGVRGLQLVPSNTQVSPRSRPPPLPPQRTAKPLPAAKAEACLSRPGGDATRALSVQAGQTHCDVVGDSAAEG